MNLIASFIAVMVLCIQCNCVLLQPQSVDVSNVYIKTSWLSMSGMTKITSKSILNVHSNSLDRTRENESWKELHRAIEAGSENEVQRLLLNSVNVNNVNETTGNSALLLAAMKGYEKIVQMLIEEGASVNAGNQEGETALIHAAFNGYESIVRLLIGSGAGVIIADKLNNTALMAASSKGFEKIVELLIQKGADVNVVGEKGYTALIWAARGGFEKIVRMLIEKSANVNTGNQDGDTALILAAFNGHESTVRLLIGNGANVNIVNKFNNSALILALYKGFENIAELLIRNGADINIVGNYGKTALMNAAEKGLEKIVQMLIDACTTVDTVDEINNTAFLYAARRLWDVDHLLQNNTLYENETILTAAEKIAQLLMVKSKSVTDHGDPLLVVAASQDFRSEKAVELLIKNGTNVNVANKYGTTALMAAAKKGNEIIVKLLLETNATNVNAVDSDGHTALDAVNIAYKGHEKLIRLLSQYGAEYRGFEVYRRASEKACQSYSNLTARWRYGTETRVFDGSFTEIGEFPWMVALGYLNKEYKISFSCGGSLISDRFVLTAAHCVKDIQRPVVARLGKISLSDEDDFLAENQNIQEIILHSKYSLVTKKNDIALIRLIARVSFSEFIQPICLYTDSRDIDTRVDLIVTGWGTLNSGKTSNDLRKIELKTMPLSDCNRNLLNYNKKRHLASLRSGFDRSQYCAHDPIGRKDSCQGDSGGPLQMAQSHSNPAKVVGIVSFGIGCGRGRPGIYTRVAHYIEWIGSHVWPNATIDTPQININSV